MSWLQPKLHLRVAQKQILTPGLVQMVSVLALNRLELREMINQEMIENPVLEDYSDGHEEAGKLKALAMKELGINLIIDDTIGVCQAAKSEGVEVLHLLK